MEVFQDAMRRELEGFEVGEVIELFTVDARNIGGDVYRFAPSPVVGSDGVQKQPQYGSNVYSVIPFESEGWDFAAGGTLPQPIVRFMIAREDADQISISSYLLAMLETFDDLLGAQVFRVQTLRKFLDDGSEPNSQANMGLEIYTVAQKSNQTPDMIEFKLQSALDLEDVLLPRRQVLNYCQWRYRRPRNDGSFDYEGATCPYVGQVFFDQNGDRVWAVAQDRCGRQLSDCKARFGANGKLPYGGFPGVGKFGG